MRALPTTLVMLGLAAACTRTVVVTNPEIQTGGPSTAATLGVPPGHLPHPGECRVWIPGVPPGRQPRPKSRPCRGIEATAPAGGWILYRPATDRKLAYVRVVDDARAGVIVRVRVFEIETGKLVREENP